MELLELAGILWNMADRATLTLITARAEYENGEWVDAGVTTSRSMLSYDRGVKDTTLINATTADRYLEWSNQGY